MTAENIEKIGALFPSAITEIRGEDGQLKKGINFEVLKQLLSPDVVDGDERYEFTWVGKKAAVAEAARPTTKTLRPVKEDSRNWDTTENLYIEGDNLEVLKILQESYLGKVKMIYIDPPYNTGNDFIYADSFMRSQKEENEQMGMYDEDENRLFKNTDTNGKFHSDWCSMIYSRLMLARNLLTDDGVIFISINDKEISSLKHICSEVFGEANFLATLVWDKNHSAQSGVFKVYHEYILVYCKNFSLIKTPKSLNHELFEAGAMKKVSGRHPASKFTFPAGTRFDAPDETEFSGEYGDTEKVVVLNGRMIAHNHKLLEDVTLEAGFTQTNQMKQYFYGDKETLVDSQGQKIIEFYFNSNGKIKVIKERSVESPQTTCHYGTQGAASNELANLFGLDESPFSSPKPVGMIKDFILRFVNDGDIILDFFSGSATTAHAVYEANSSGNIKHTKYILAQIEENLDESLKSAQKDAVRTLEVGIDYLNSVNKPHTVCEIGKERIRRAGDKIKAEHPDADLDIGFRVFRVDESNMKDVYYHPEEVTQMMLGETVSNIKEDRADMDLLYACLLDWGVEIHLPHTSTQVEDCTVHDVDHGALVACFDKALPRAVVEYIARLQPLRAVFRDSAFATDAEKINVTEIFKNLSPDTKVKVI